LSPESLLFSTKFSDKTFRRTNAYDYTERSDIPVNPEIFIVFGILIGAAVLFVSNKIRSDLVGMLVLLALMMSGVLTVRESLAGFSDPVLVVIVAMFIVSEALVNTGVAQKIGEFVLKVGGGSEMFLIPLLMAAVAGIGAFMSSTAAVAIFIPISLTVANKARLNPKRLLMPLAMGGLISGMMTLIGTPPNLVVDGALQEKGLDPIGFFSFSPFGLAVLSMAIIYVLIFGRKMLAKEEQSVPEKKSRTTLEMVRSYGLIDRLYRLRVSTNSPWIGHSVAESRMRTDYGFQCIAVEKKDFGSRKILQVEPGIVFDAGDEILVLGNKENIDSLTRDNELAKLPLKLPYPDTRKSLEFKQKVGLAEIMLLPDSELVGKTLKEIQFRSRYKVSVVSLRRRGQPLTGELSDIPLDFGDALLVNAAWPDIRSLRDERENFVVLTLPEDLSEIAPAQKRAPLALAILGAMVGTMAFGLMPTVMAALLAAFLLIITRCVKLESIYHSINWHAVILIAGILPLATALDKSGAASLVAQGMVNTLGELGPMGMLVVIFAVTAATSLFISNTATAVLIAPIAIDAALEIGASPHAFAMTVAIACSAAFVTPVSSPGNMLVMEPGGYTFLDFVKVGLPLLVLTLIATVILATLIYL